jgi:hypothetical protein
MASALPEYSSGWYAAANQRVDRLFGRLISSGSTIGWPHKYGVGLPPHQPAAWGTCPRIEDKDFLVFFNVRSMIQSDDHAETMCHWTTSDEFQISNVEGQALQQLGRTPGGSHEILALHGRSGGKSLAIPTVPRAFTHAFVMASINNELRPVTDR